jgi:hypothetical protein
MSFEDRDGGLYESVPVSRCGSGYPKKPDDVSHLKAKEEDGTVRAHVFLWGHPTDDKWIRVSDEDIENLDENR